MNKTLQIDNLAETLILFQTSMNKNKAINFQYYKRQ